MDSSKRAALLSAYQQYIDAFNSNDIDKINNNLSKARFFDGHRTYSGEAFQNPTHMKIQ